VVFKRLKNWTRTYTKSKPSTVVLLECPATFRPGTVQPRMMGAPRMFCSHVQPTRAYRCLMSMVNRPISPANPGRHETEKGKRCQRPETLKSNLKTYE
jgi:hypothetical protein